jgi:hypothetical protein
LAIGQIRFGGPLDHITVGLLAEILSVLPKPAILPRGKGLDPESRGHWPIMLGVIAIPAMIMFLGVFFLPESPRWLFLNDFKDRAVAVFEEMHVDKAEIVEQVKDVVLEGLRG